MDSLIRQTSRKMLEQMPSKMTSLVRGLAAVEVREVCGHTQRTCGSVRQRDCVNNANMRPVAPACKRQSYSVLLALVLLFCHSAALAQDSQADPKLLQVFILTIVTITSEMQRENSNSNFHRP